jgi:tRNA A58 N-methylase Trm61
VEKIIKDQVKGVFKSEPEGKIKDKDITEPHVSENIYVSYVVVDVKDNEIVIESKDNFVLPNLAVGAAI